jgi:hypothetical protein
MKITTFYESIKKSNQKKPPIRRGPPGCPVLLEAGGEL